MRHPGIDSAVFFAKGKIVKRKKRESRGKKGDDGEGSEGEVRIGKWKMEEKRKRCREKEVQGERDVKKEVMGRGAEEAKGKDERSNDTDKG